MDMLRVPALLLGLAIVLLILWDTFETIVIPKTVQRRMRVSSIYADSVWRLWHWGIDRLRDGGLRQALLSAFGPLAILFLFVAWAGVLVIGFGLIHWGLGSLGSEVGLGSSAYFSGVTFFTLGYGDLTPDAAIGRIAAVAEVATGYGFLAIVIGFVPTFYNAFSRRERFIVMMDARAGSDPSAGELLRRHAEAGTMTSLEGWLKEAEGWCAEQLENYLSYPILAYYRSQHDSQSWLAALTAVLDACSVILAGAKGDQEWVRRLRFQAQATFAMGRHVVVDLAYLIDEPPAEHPPGRITSGDFERLRAYLELGFGGVSSGFEERLGDLRGRYEPYVVGIARDLHFVLPAWTQLQATADNWQHSAWDSDEHF